MEARLGLVFRLQEVSVLEECNSEVGEGKGNEMDASKYILKRKASFFFLIKFDQPIYSVPVKTDLHYSAFWHKEAEFEEPCEAQWECGGYGIYFQSDMTFGILISNKINHTLTDNKLRFTFEIVFLNLLVPLCVMAVMYCFLSMEIF